MVRILFLYLLSFVFVLCAKANSLVLSDTISINRSDLSVLLQGRNQVEKANFLNRFYSPTYMNKLKSFSIGLQLDSIISTEWLDETQTIENSRLFTCSFRNGGKDVLVDIFRWDVVKNIWIIGDQNYYYFDDEDRLKQIEFQEYVSSDYRLITRIDYVYENDLLKFESRYDRIDEIATWSKLEQLEYKYNDSNTLKTVHLNKWDSYENDWITEFYEKYTYDSIGNLATQTGYDYNFFSMVATKKYVLQHKYNEANILIETIEYIPGWEEESFVPERKQENLYNSISFLESETFYNWNYDADDWLGNVKLNYSAQIDGAKIHENTSFLWAENESKWEGSQKKEFFAENNFLASDIQNWQFIETYMPAYSFEGFACDEIINSIWENNRWVNSGIASYYFSEGYPVGIDELAEMEINIYPNPVDDVVNIEINNQYEHTCTVRNISGVIVLQTIFRNTTQLNLSAFCAGVYLVELVSENGKIQIRKIIKR